jgi:hypothetical protein
LQTTRPESAGDGQIDQSDVRDDSNQLAPGSATGYRKWPGRTTTYPLPATGQPRCAGSPHRPPQPTPRGGCSKLPRFFPFDERARKKFRRPDLVSRRQSLSCLSAWMIRRGGSWDRSLRPSLTCTWSSGSTPSFAERIALSPPIPVTYGLVVGRADRIQPAASHPALAGVVRRVCLWFQPFCLDTSFGI